VTEIAQAASSTKLQQQRPGGIAFGAAGPTFGGILSGLTAAPSVRSPGATWLYRTAYAVTPLYSNRAGVQSGSTTKAIASIPESSQQALQQAMALEKVPESWRNGLQFIMARESGGRVDVRNPRHSARGLYQLTAANYHFNPRGKDSFGNAVEEAQGGIRYIKQRYGTVEKAVAFWQQNRWY
jgi:hypothetical protein